MSLYGLSGITKVYDGKKVLDIDALTLEKGKIYSLIGPNGAGKTSLLKILAFLDFPSSGKLTFCSEPVVFSEKRLQPVRKRVVLVEQFPILFTTTVYKNIEFGLKIRKIPIQRRKALIDEVLGLVDMEHMTYAMAHKLSGGETHRIALARALALSPEVILCDEPTSGVDLENQFVINRLIARINREKKISIVFTSHDRLQASSLAQHFIFLEHGKLSSAVYENMFTAVAEEQKGGLSRCVIQDSLTLYIPECQQGTKRILIDPQQIMISDRKNRDSLVNTRQGKIIQIAEENAKIRVIIDCDIYITMVMAPEIYRDLQLMVGKRLRIYIPPEAVQVL